MALEIMLRGGKNFRHQLHHDLESIFYVLIWVCCHMEGPEVERDDPYSLPIREWCNMNLKLAKIGLIKLSHLANFEDSILKHFTPYWQDFKPFMRELKSAFWPESFETPNSITSDVMLSILKKAAASIHEVQSGGVDTTPAPVVQSYVLLNSKRSRQGQDTAMVSKRPRAAVTGTSKGRMSVQDSGIWKESIMIEDSSLSDSEQLSYSGL
jgi:hypothetical protein